MRRRPLPLLLATLSFFLAVTTLAAPARADGWTDAGDARLEDRLLDGDLDAEDLAARAGLPRRSGGPSHPQSQTWVSLVGFYRNDPAGPEQWGLMGVVGVALDRIAQGKPPEVAHLASSSAPLAEDTAPRSGRPLAALLARGAVRAAWRAAGIDADDERIDGMIARARASAALPEARVRAMRLVDDAQHTTTTAVDPLGAYYDGVGSKLWLEARLTWRLDRLLYADDEPTIERIRLERQDARARVAGRVLDLLFAWARAAADAAGATADSRAELDAQLRRWEAEIALDVATGGWFTRQPGVAPP